MCLTPSHSLLLACHPSQPIISLLSISLYREIYKIVLYTMEFFFILDQDSFDAFLNWNCFSTIVAQYLVHYLTVASCVSRAKEIDGTVGNLDLF